MTALPLEGVRVLEVSHIVAGPAVGMILGDMGADVVKVEPPDVLMPHRTGYARGGGYYFLNRNKRGIILDLKNPDAIEVFLRLAERSDVLIENQGPGTMDRLGIGYDDLSRRNPGIIYSSVKGFLRGPYSARPLLDELAQMMSGLAYMTGPLGQPLRAGASVVDMGAAMFAVIGILGALRQRDATGLGQRITGGLFETALYFVGPAVTTAQLTGQTPPPMANRDRSRGNSIYDLFPTSDETRVFIAVTSEAQWKRLCEALELDDLANDPRMQSNAGRLANREVLIPRLEAATMRRTAAELAEQLNDAGVPVGPLNTPRSVADDPHVRAPGRMLPLHVEGREVMAPNMPYESSAYPIEERLDPPEEPGRDSRAVLEDAGFTATEIASLLASGAVLETAEHPPK